MRRDARSGLTNQRGRCASPTPGPPVAIRPAVASEKLLKAKRCSSRGQNQASAFFRSWLAATDMETVRIGISPLQLLGQVPVSQVVNSFRNLVRGHVPATVGEVLATDLRASGAKSSKVLVSVIVSLGRGRRMSPRCRVSPRPIRSAVRAGGFAGPSDCGRCSAHGRRSTALPRRRLRTDR